MNLLCQILALAAGGAAGAMLRGWMSERFASIMPWTTLAINVSGAFTASWLVARYGNGSAHPLIHTLFVVGFCGGYTTFSTLAFQLLVQWRNRHSWQMAFYLLLTLTLGLAAAWAGLALGE